MRVTVKICGVTRLADARAAAEAGADYVGFVFFPASRRCLSQTDAEWIRTATGAHRVGVFRDQPRDQIERLRDTARLDRIQLHGAEDPELCAALGGRARVIKAISVADRIDWGRVAEYDEVATVLFDTASPTGGGTGQVFDWRTLGDRPAALRFWLAGGLDPTNVADAVRALHPSGVDVASGVESEVGCKDPAKIRAFIATVRAAAAGCADGNPAGGR